MHVLDHLKLTHAMEAISPSRTHLKFTSKMMEAQVKLAKQAPNLLAGLGKRLATWLRTGWDPEKWTPAGGQQERFSWLRQHEPDQKLMELACLFGWAWRHAFDAPRSQIKPQEFFDRAHGGFTEDKRNDALEWLAAAIECLEAFHLLPPPLQGELLRPVMQEREPVVIGHDLAGFRMIQEGASKPEAWALGRDEVFEAYRGLSARDGRAMALYALEMLETGTRTGRNQAEIIFSRLAAMVPGSLRGLHARLVPHRMDEVYRGIVYRGADANARDLLIEVDQKSSRDTSARMCLAQIGDATVQTYFARCRKRILRSVPQEERWRVERELESYCTEAGWQLTKDGKRRQLYFDSAYRLILASTAPKNALPVRSLCPPSRKKNVAIAAIH